MLVSRVAPSSWAMGTLHPPPKSLLREPSERSWVCPQFLILFGEDL